MKRLVIIVLLVWGAASPLAAQNEKDSILQYFPYNIGNLWKYELAGNPRKSVIVRSSGPSTYHRSSGWYDFYRTPHKEGESTVSTLNIDTARMIVSNQSIFSPYEADLASKPGDPFGYSGRCDSIRTDTVLGMPTTIKYFSEKGEGWSRQYKMAWKIGIVDGSDGGEFYGFSLSASYRLTFARINGISYGQLLNSIEKDSLMKFYPFQIGNVWVYTMTTVIPWQLPSSRQIRKEVISDTLIDGKRYYTMLTTDPKGGSTQSQLFRIDSTTGNVYSRWPFGKESLYDSLSADDMTGYFSSKGGERDTVFGAIVPVRNILEHVTIDDVNDRSAAWGIGLIGYGSEDYNGMSETAVLVYAKINGKEFGVMPTSVAAEEQTKPLAFSLEQNYPNPFNPSTTISFSLPSKSFVSLKVFDEVGREVATIVSENLPAGRYERQWTATGISSGLYFYRLQAGASIGTKRLLLVK